MWKNKLYEIITEHWSKITTIGIFSCVIIMIIMIKTYMNYSAIIDEITRVNADIEQINEEIAYSENFYKAYLDSEYAPYFLAHKNNTLFYNEMIIRFIDPYATENESSEGNTDTTTPTSYSGVSVMTPQQSRQNFIKSKINN